MKETKFTPGPWKVCEPFNADIQAPDGLDIATCCPEILNRHTDGEEGRANAYLIAAAPDMYEALKNVLKLASTETMWDELVYIDFTEIRDVLKKARGEV